MARGGGSRTIGDRFTASGGGFRARGGGFRAGGGGLRAGGGGFGTCSISIAGAISTETATAESVAPEGGGGSMGLPFASRSPACKKGRNPSNPAPCQPVQQSKKTICESVQIKESALLRIFSLRLKYSPTGPRGGGASRPPCRPVWRMSPLATHPRAVF
jgi:hypothetical protein